MNDREHFEKTRRQIIETREELSERLRWLGFTVLPSQANFVFARHPHRDALELSRKLRQRDIIIRHFRQPRIEQFLRITIGNDGDCAVLITALAEILQD
jgi:histidinol-phosphate aminotransferase